MIQLLDMILCILGGLVGVGAAVLYGYFVIWTIKNWTRRG